MRPRGWLSVLPAAAMAIVLPAAVDWKVEPTPTTAADPATLYSVSCTSSAWCMAVGAYSVRTEHDDVLVSATRAILTKRERASGPARER